MDNDQIMELEYEKSAYYYPNISECVIIEEEPGRRNFVFRRSDRQIPEQTCRQDRTTFRNLRSAMKPWKERPSKLLCERLDPKYFRKQAQSTFFSKLPPELRNEIYQFVLQQHQNKDQPYSSDSAYWRPSFLFPRFTDTAILYTCRRAYIEAALFPLQNATHFIWDKEYPERTKAPGAKSLNSTSGIGLQHLPHIRHLCCIGAFKELVRSLTLFMPSPLLPDNPRALTPETIQFVVVRGFGPSWRHCAVPSLYADGVEINDIVFPATLKEFRFTCDGLEKFKDLIDKIADAARRKWRIKRKDGVELSAEGILTVVEQFWKGTRPERLRDDFRDGNSYYLDPEMEEIEELSYYGVTVTFRPRSF